MNKKIIYILFIVLSFILILPGCATTTYVPATKFIAPIFNLEVISNPPEYPDGKLSSRVIKAPTSLSIMNEVIWYEDNSIAFQGIEDIHVFNVESNNFIEIIDDDKKNKIKGYLEKSKINWVEDTSIVRSVLNKSINLLELLGASIFTIADPDHYSGSKTYYGYCQNIDRTKKVKIMKIESERGQFRLAGASYSINGEDIKYNEGGIFLSSDGLHLISGSNVYNVMTGKPIPIPVTQKNSIPPTIIKYIFSPDLSKIMIIYQDSEFNSYSFEIVDYNLPRSDLTT